METRRSRAVILNSAVFPHADIPDQQLVARVVAARDRQAFGELVRRYQSPVRNFLRKMTADNALADDLAQDCFLTAWRKLDSYHASGSLAG